MAKFAEIIKKNLLLFVVAIGFVAVFSVNLANTILLSKISKSLEKISVSGSVTTQQQGSVDFMASLKKYDISWYPDEYDPVYGNIDSAKAIILEYTDFQCPFCARHTINTFPSIKQNYIDTGKIAYVYKDLPLSFHQYARKAALYGECVYEEYGLEKFNEFKHWMFANQQTWETDNMEEIIDQKLQELGMDPNKIHVCMNESGPAQDLQKDTSEAQKWGITGTPGFVILLKKDEISKEDYQSIQDLLDTYEQYGLRYKLGVTNDGKYFVVRFAGALPYDVFDTILSKAFN